MNLFPQQSHRFTMRNSEVVTIYIKWSDTNS